MEPNIWIFVVGCTLSVIGILALWILNSINSQVKELSKELREGFADHDRRITKLEVESGYHVHRRSENGRAAQSA